MTTNCAIIKGNLLKVTGYTGDGWFEYAEAITDNNGCLIGIHYYRRNNGWVIDSHYMCVEEFADESDLIASPIELAIEWVNTIDLTDEELDLLVSEID